MTQSAAARLQAKYDGLLADMPEPVRRQRAANDFGSDTLCVDQLRPGRQVTGFRLVGQRLYHRIITPPGTLRGSKTLLAFGLGIESVIGAAVSSGPLRGSIAGRVKTALELDPAVFSADVRASQQEISGGLFAWTIPAEVRTSAGPFELVIGVDEGLTAALLKLEPLRRAA